MTERTYDDDRDVGTKALTGGEAPSGRELPVRGEVVRIFSGELAGEEAMVEAVERDRSVGRTFVRLRIYGFPWPVEEPAYAVIRLHGVSSSHRGHRWASRKPF